VSESLFTGLKVIDCASWIAGPAAATIMSDFGADVIKIEPPGVGDPWRGRGPIPGRDVDYYWQLTARNKRSLAIDLKHDEMCIRDRPRMVGARPVRSRVARA